jgi:hypothetical protein
MLWLRVDFPEPEMPHVIRTVLWFVSRTLSKISRIWGGRGIVGFPMLDLMLARESYGVLCIEGGRRLTTPVLVVGESLAEIHRPHEALTRQL